MKIFLTNEEVLELAIFSLDLNQPNPDHLHEIAERMDMRYDEESGLFEDIERMSIRQIIFNSKMFTNAAGTKPGDGPTSSRIREGE